MRVVRHETIHGGYTLWTNCRGHTKGAISHGACTTPIITVFVPGTPLYTTHLQKRLLINLKGRFLCPNGRRTVFPWAIRLTQFFSEVNISFWCQ